MGSSVRLGRIAGIEFGVNWSWLVVFALIVWTLASASFPSTNPGLSKATYIAMAVVAAFLFCQTEGSPGSSRRATSPAHSTRGGDVRRPRASDLSADHGRSRSVFQPVLAIELAVTGALLWQIRFFESRDARRQESERLLDSRLRPGLRPGRPCSGRELVARAHHGPAH